MAELDLEVVKASLRDGTNSGSVEYGAVARLRRLDGKSDARSVAVGVGTTTRLTGLATGQYEVQLHLPSGHILAEEVDVGAQAPSRVVFDAGGSPSGSLGWQHYAGAVKSRSNFPDASINLRGFAERMATVRAPSFENDENEPRYAGTSAGATMAAKPKLLIMETPPANEAIDENVEKTVEIWETLARGASGELRALQMIKGFQCRRQVADEELGGRESWRFGFAPDLKGGQRTPRRFALVQFESGNELVSLPLPWRMRSTDGAWQTHDFVDLLVDSGSARPVRTSVLVRDANYGGIIAYMSNGAMGLAGEMMRADNGIEHRAVELLGAKALSPLGACAAAYVLLSTMSLDDPANQRWLEWIENLGRMPQYRWIPDATLLRARLTLQRADSEVDARAAIPLLMRSLRGGLPYFSLGLSWMLEGLTHFRNEDPILGQIFPHVEKVSRYLDVSQAFLVLKLGKGKA